MRSSLLRPGHPSSTVATFLGLCFSLANAACQDGRDRHSVELGHDVLGVEHGASGSQPPISGTVFFLQRVAGAPVVLYSVKETGERLDPIVATSTDEAGYFRLDPGAYEGPAVLEAVLASPSIQIALPIEHVELGASSLPVVLSPVTTLMAAYADYLAHAGLSWRESVVAATQAFNAHFFGLDHVHTVPAAWPVEAGRETTTCALSTPEFQASLVCRSLAALGAGHLAPSAQDLTPEEGLHQLLQNLQNDLLADGLLDGRPTAFPTPPAYARLGPEVARDALAEAMDAFLRGPANHSGCSADAAQPLVTHLRASNKNPLPYRKGPPAPQPVLAPPEVHCSLFDAADEKRSFADVLRGTVSIECSWKSDAPMLYAGLDGHDGLPWLQQVDSAGANVASFRVDTEAIERAHHVGELRINLRGHDSAAQVTRDHVTLKFRNASPAVEVGQFLGGRGRPQDVHRVYYEFGKEIALPVRVDPAARLVRLYADGRLIDEHVVPEQAKAEPDMVSVALHARLSTCDHTSQLRLSVVDVAGNETQKLFQATCLSDAPKIVPLLSEFVPDHGVAQAPLQQGWEGAAPPLLQKFFHKFELDPLHGKDAVANNLPVVRFRVDEASAAHLVPGYRVSYAYRYLRLDHTNSFPVEMNEGDWETLEPAGPNTFALPLSYQTLLPRALWNGDPERARRHNYLAASRPADLHEVRFRVENEAGDVDEKTFRFALDLRGPHLQVREVGLEPAVLDSAYESALDRMRHDRRGLVAAEVFWPLGWTEHSLFPRLQLEVSGTADLTVFAEVEHIDQWDRLDCAEWSTCYHGHWPREDCKKSQHLYTNDRNRNAAWSQSRGCHPPVKDHYAKNRRSYRYVANAQQYAHDANLIAPRTWVACRSHAARMALTADMPARLGFTFPILESEDKRWQLSRGREGLFQEYHVVSEDDFHFGHRKKMHVLTTDYYVIQLAARAESLRPERVTGRPTDARYPGPIGTQLLPPTGEPVKRWGVDFNKKWPIVRNWDVGWHPRYGDPRDLIAVEVP